MSDSMGETTRSYQTRVTLNGVVRPGLEISVHREPEETVVVLVGEIDMGTVARLRATVDEALSDGPTRLVLDMGGVTVCDSMGLGTLTVLARNATSARSSLVLTNVRPLLNHSLDVAGLRHWFTIRDRAEKD